MKLFWVFHAMNQHGRLATEALFRRRVDCHEHPRSCKRGQGVITDLQQSGIVVWVLRDYSDAHQAIGLVQWLSWAFATQASDKERNKGWGGMWQFLRVGLSPLARSRGKPRNRNGFPVSVW